MAYTPRPEAPGVGVALKFEAAASILGGLLARSSETSDDALIDRAVLMTDRLLQRVMTNLQAAPPRKRVRVQVGSRIIYVDRDSPEGQEALNAGRVLPERGR